ncbi:MAG: methyltransferase [Pseudomonadota bacterium]
MNRLLLLPLLFIATAQAATLEEKIEAALAAESRPAADRERDANRSPLETLTFFGMTDDMRVLELVPGGGWYTRVLAPVLRENGELYAAIGTGRVKDTVLTEPGFDHVKLLEPEVTFERVPPVNHVQTNSYTLDVRDVDLALTFRNLHNFTPDSRRVMNEAVFAALKPGGHYGVVDHTARHMEPLTMENRRRMDPVLAIQEITAVGFEFVGFSDVHYRPDDELEYEVGRKTVTGNTDRFTLLFRKPE